METLIVLYVRRNPISDLHYYENRVEQCHGFWYFPTPLSFLRGHTREKSARFSSLDTLLILMVTASPMR